MIVNDDLKGQRDAPVQKLLLTVPEAGRALAISRSKMYDLLNSGHLPSVHIGRSRRVRVSDIENFVDSGGVSYESN
jgi:excisionase family DNA binding protein